MMDDSEIFIRVTGVNSKEEALHKIVNSPINIRRDKLVYNASISGKFKRLGLFEFKVETSEKDTLSAYQGVFK